MEDKFQNLIYWQDHKHRSWCYIYCLCINITVTVLLFEPVLPYRCRGGGVDVHPWRERLLYFFLFGTFTPAPLSGSLYCLSVTHDLTQQGRRITVNLPKWQLALHPAPNPRGSGDLNPSKGQMCLCLCQLWKCQVLSFSAKSLPSLLSMWKGSCVQCFNVCSI